MLNFSVIVCSALRPLLLKRCLESLVIQTFPIAGFEIIVINNVPDRDAETQLIIQKIKTPVTIRYAIEEVEGLSPARNRGISLANGEILAFIDDDAVADRNWLQNLFSVYESNPDAASVGGMVKLIWETSIPNWLSPSLFSFLSGLDYGDHILQIEKNQTKRHLNGCNFSIKRSVFDKLGGFSHRLGRDHHTLLSGEETEMFIRIQKDGGACYYSPDAFVNHLAPENRMDKQFFRKRAYWGGRSSARIDSIHFNNQIPGSFLQKMIHIPYYLTYSTWPISLINPAKSFQFEIYFWLAIGYIAETLGTITSSEPFTQRK